MTVPNQFPENTWSRIFVRGKFIDMTGAPMKGQVQFSTNVTGGTLLDRHNRLIISSRPYQANLDDNGYFEIQLPATNDPDITPTSFTYSVKEPTGRSYPIVVPYDTPTLTRPGDPLTGQQVIDLIDIVPAPGVSGGVGQLIRGIGVQSVDIDDSSNLIVTYSDGSTHNAGFIPSGGEGGSTPDATTTTKGKAVLVGGTADQPTVPWDKVTDRPSTLPPSGAASGVLSGSYPSPGFAQDMATQAELDTGLAGKANTADLAGVATTGDYADLTGTPEIPQLPTLADVATTGDYADLTNTPPIPAAYTDEQAQDATAVALAAGTHSGIIFTYDDAGKAISATVTLSGGDGGLNETQVDALITAAVDGLAAVAETGSYNDLTDKPITPTLADVATSGDYTDLSNTPTIPSTPGDIGAQPAGDYATTDQLAATVTSATIATITQLTAAEYDSLATKDPATLYVVVD